MKLLVNLLVKKNLKNLLFLEKEKNSKYSPKIFFKLFFKNIVFRKITPAQ